eukprot:NODE_10427_length_306_cov_259.494024.p3 GENE.NODE_10427_length_306_cov_259.494024~~NODE_10427_length_306_cov_259.494024.p3  ORF type:complete len:76 (+),score=25.65 NODE_10427_length_306_cov_259.494024:3-230(+)
MGGAKFFEGGPYKPGKPLDRHADLRENMLVLQDIHRVMAHVGCSNGRRANDEGWSRLWPYGVFTVAYEFEELPLH